MSETQTEQTQLEATEVTQNQVDKYSDYTNISDTEITKLLSKWENTEVEKHYNILHSKLEALMDSQDFKQADYDKLTNEINQINKGFENLKTAKTFDMNWTPTSTIKDINTPSNWIENTFNLKEQQEKMEELTPFHNKAINYDITKLTPESISNLELKLEESKFTPYDINKSIAWLWLKPEDVQKWFEETNNSGIIEIDIDEIRKENNQIIMEFDNPWNNKEFNKISLFNQIKPDWTLKEDWLWTAIQSSVNLMKNIDKKESEKNDIIDLDESDPTIDGEMWVY